MTGSVDIRPLETTYRGIRFRSRTEAKWAVFYDAAGIHFDHEPQGWSLNGEPYLPDFWLPAQRVWVECKGTPPTAQEQHLASLLAQGTGNNVYIFHGGLVENLEGLSDSALCFMPDGASDQGYRWCQCPRCHVIGIEFEGRHGRLCKCGMGDREGAGAPSDFLRAAYNVAIGKRFWDAPDHSHHRAAPVH